MALSEEQVRRYSRQILLSEVGGRGQERLLSSGAELTGAGPALATAAAYLAAAGCSVRCADRALMAGERGFLFTSEDVGRSGADALRAAAADMNPDAVSGAGAGCVGEMPASFSGPGPWVAMGGRGDCGELVYRSPSGCAQCFAENLAGLSSPPAPASALLGALAAAAFQRICLGLSEHLGRLGVDESGTVLELEPRRCRQCA